jgi:hypothetical protein
MHQEPKWDSYAPNDRPDQQQAAWQNSPQNTPPWQNPSGQYNQPPPYNPYAQGYAPPNQFAPPPYQQNQPPLYYNVNQYFVAPPPEYTGKAVIVLILYFLAYIPGLIVNIVFLAEASRTKAQYGSAPGMGCLVALLILPLIALVCFFLLFLMAAL